MGFSSQRIGLCVVLMVLCQSLVAHSQNLPAIEIKGSKFFYPNNGSQFILKGVNYQFLSASDEQGSVSADLARLSDQPYLDDPLSNSATGTANAGCARDIPYLLQLQTNVVRSFGFNSSLGHSICMTQLANAGIHVLVDLAAPGLTIQSNNPVWNDALYDRFTSVIDAMHNYTNLLGFIVGDNAVKGLDARGSGPYVKAAVRDMKGYIQQKGYRSIPIGYVSDVVTSASADVDSSVINAVDFLTCGNISESIDFFGANGGTFCQDSTFTDSGYKSMTNAFASYPIPKFLAAYGCSQYVNRDWSEIPVIYGDEMSPVWSGGLAFQYFQQANGPGYGLVNVLGSTGIDNGVTPEAAFRNVSSRMAAISPSTIKLAQYYPTNTAQAICPSGAATTLPANPRGLVKAANVTEIGQQTASVTQPPQAQNGNDSGSRLPRGAIAGISVTAGICAIGILALILFLIRRRASRRRQEQDRSLSDEWTKTELAADEVDREAKGYAYMVDSDQRLEMEDTSAVGEVSADPICCEVSAESGIIPELSVTPAADDVSSTGTDTVSRASSTARPALSRATSAVSAISRS